MKVRVSGVELELLPQKAIKIEEDLLIADVHLGKIRHFRKVGIALPANAAGHVGIGRSPD